MDWIKRNLFFVIGGAVALVLLGLAGFYLYSGMAKNNGAVETLNQQYAQLEALNRSDPHPGSEKTDNISAAKEQQQQVRAFMGKASKAFVVIPPIPKAADLNSAMFAEALRRTIDRMQKDASSAGVQLPEKYHFSFTAIRPLLVFDQAGVLPLATQLGEIKAICDVLFSAKVNALDGIRRERVSTNDLGAQQTSDYIDKTSVTNEIAVVTPYEVTIRCFSSELGGVLSGFAASPHCLIVKAINVEPATVTGVALGEAGMGGPAAYTPPPTYLQPVQPVQPGQPDQAFAARYGRRGNIEAPGRAPVPAYVPPPTYGAPAPSRGGLPTLLDEKQFKVTLLIEVVKLTIK